MTPTPPATADVTRRRFLGRLTGLIAAAIGAALALPVVGYLIGPSFRRKSAGRLSAGTVTGLLPGQAVQREVVVETLDGWMKSQTTKGIWVAKLPTGELRVYNPHCTHLGCAYRWNPGDGRFQCPCHGGVYDLEGRVVAGPPPRPLDTLEYRIEDERLVVTYEDFQIGTSKKTPL
jgi:menaquinol-cytochrome c reductase iron-sulfur subunit